MPADFRDTTLVYSRAKDGTVKLIDSSGSARYFGQLMGNYFVYDRRPDLGAFSR